MFLARNTAVLTAILVFAAPAADAAPRPAASFDVVVVGGTPAGIMAAIAVARAGQSAVILERSAHLGGLPANGLGATDIATRGATGGLFLEFVRRVRAQYAADYGEHSRQVSDCSDGYHFEPSVAEGVFEKMLAEQPGIAVLRRRQFDAKPSSVTMQGARLAQIRVTDRRSGKSEAYLGKVFIDATYEGDLAAATGAPFRTGRESREQTGEALAGKIYKIWDGPIAEGSTGEGDDSVQAYNYRLCLTREPGARAKIRKPAHYHRAEYASIAEDVKLQRTTAGVTVALDGISRFVNLVELPNGTTDANNQHLAFVSTDLPEENRPWPTAGWAFRDRFAVRLREYTLGLLWFCQHDASLPPGFRARCGEWGLARGEYRDNGHFPRQPYVREGRRIEGEFVFSASDAQPAPGTARPPLHADSITASHYALDSHAVHKREPGRASLEGFFNAPSQPYTVPYGVIVPRTIDGLLTPVAVSATHVGFGTLRMEPCWMALGEAAGTAAAISIARKTEVRTIDRVELQRVLIKRGAVLIYYQDVPPGHAAFAAVEFFGLRGFLPDWKARPDDLAGDDAARWSAWAGVPKPPGKSRGEVLQALYRAVEQLAPERIAAIQAR